MKSALGALRDKVTGFLRGKTGVSFDRMATKVNANGEKAATLIGIRPKVAGVDQVLADIRAANMDLISDAGGIYLDQVADVLTDADNFQLPTEQLADLIEERGKVSRSRAELIAVDQTLKTNAGLTRVRHEAAGIRSYTWSSSMDERVRPMHEDLEGQKFDYDDPPETTKDGETNNPGEDYRCLPGDSRIVFVPMIQGAFRRRYRGQLTSLVTNSGETLDATPNHPILTSSGWKAAENVDVGDYVFDIREHRSHFPEENVHDRDPTISEIFDALAMMWGTRRIVQRASWFHGDGTVDEEVDVIDVDRPLLLDAEMARAKRFCELILSIPDQPSARGGALYHVLVRLGLPANGVVRRLGDRLAVLDRRLREADGVRLRPTSQLDAAALEKVADRLSWDLVAFRECQDGLAFGVETQAFVLREVFRVMRPSIVSNDGDTPSADLLGEVVRIAPQTPSDVCKAFPGLHRAHRIVDKGTREFSSHVFNLQTSAGWYGASIAVKNCRCIAIPVLDEEEEEPEEPGPESPEPTPDETEEPESESDDEAAE